VYPNDFRKWLRAFFERLCLFFWMFLMMANTVVLGLSAELLVFGVVFSLDNILLINAQTAPLLLCGVFATMTFPMVVRLRRYGVENLNFELHESALNQFMDPPESWSNVILTLLDETALRSNELVTLVRLIDEAPGPVERQDRRAEAKAWLKNNRDKLTNEDEEFVNQYLGYLR
jgi:ABC-type Fe3+ transport system permease subunit